MNTCLVISSLMPGHTSLAPEAPSFGRMCEHASSWLVIPSDAPQVQRGWNDHVPGEMTNISVVSAGYWMNRRGWAVGICDGLVTTRPFRLTSAVSRVILFLHQQILCSQFDQRGRARAGRHQPRCQVSPPPGTSRMFEHRSGFDSGVPLGYAVALRCPHTLVPNPSSSPQCLSRRLPFAPGPQPAS